MAQKSQLERDLAHARITDFKDAATDTVGIGNIVELKTEAGAVQRFTILGAWDGDPAQHIISYKTPLGLALLAKKAGERVQVKTGNADEKYTVVRIARYADTPGA
jgi:transcription elongation GreA/GreB family factor